MLVPTIYSMGMLCSSRAFNTPRATMAREPPPLNAKEILGKHAGTSAVRLKGRFLVTNLGVSVKVSLWAKEFIEKRSRKNTAILFV